MSKNQTGITNVFAFATQLVRTLVLGRKKKAEAKPIVLSQKTKQGSVGRVKMLKDLLDVGRSTLTKSGKHEDCG